MIQQVRWRFVLFWAVLLLLSGSVSCYLICLLLGVIS